MDIQSGKGDPGQHHKVAHPALVQLSGVHPQKHQQSEQNGKYYHLLCCAMFLSTLKQ